MRSNDGEGKPGMTDPPHSDNQTPFVRAALSQRPCFPVRILALSGAHAPEPGCGSQQPPSQPDDPDVQLPPEIEQPGVPMTNGTPVACRQKNAAEYLAGRSPGVMAQYGDGLFGAEQHTKSRQPAPDKDESGVLQLVEWREEAPYG